jgi:hypothetical protein
MKRLNSTPNEARRVFYCPQCDKQRMVRDADHSVSNEKQKYTDRNNEEIELLTDICDFCQQSNYRKHFEPTKADIRKVIKAMQEEGDVGDQSLEDLL